MSEATESQEEIMTDDFDAFVERQAAAVEAEQPDWDRQRDEWLELVADLYRQVQGYIAAYIERRRINVRVEPIMLTEEYIGTYEIDRLVIAIGPAEVRLTPVGTLLVGSKGRVDMEGKQGSVSFLLVDKDARRPTVTVQTWMVGQPKPLPIETKMPLWTWKILKHTPGISFLELTEQSFREALLKVANA